MGFKNSYMQKYKEATPKFRKPENDVDKPIDYKDKHQVELDISRVQLSKAAAAKLEKRIGKVLASNNGLNYYQGFHDVAMHTHNHSQLENLALQQLRDFMAPSLIPTMQVLKIVPELLARADPEGLGSFLNGAPSNSRRINGYFALAPVVTLFSHDCTDTRIISPIIRNVLREGLAYILYLYTALIIKHCQSANELRETIEKSEDLSEDDGFELALRGICAKLTVENFEEIDQHARLLRTKYPLKRLQTYQSISKFSVLKSGKLTKRSTALYVLEQLNNQSDSGELGVLNPNKTALVVAVGAIAFGMLWTKLHK